MDAQSLPVGRSLWQALLRRGCCGRPIQLRARCGRGPFGHALRLRGRCGRRIGALLREMQRGRWEGEGGGRGGKGARVILEENVVSRNLPKRGALA